MSIDARLQAEITNNMRRASEDLVRAVQQISRVSSMMSSDLVETADNVSKAAKSVKDGVEDVDKHIKDSDVKKLREREKKLLARRLDGLSTLFLHEEKLTSEQLKSQAQQFKDKEHAERDRLKDLQEQHERLLKQQQTNTREETEARKKLSQEYKNNITEIGEAERRVRAAEARKSSDIAKLQARVGSTANAQQSQALREREEFHNAQIEKERERLEEIEKKHEETVKQYKNSIASVNGFSRAVRENIDAQRTAQENVGKLNTAIEQNLKEVRKNRYFDVFKKIGQDIGSALKSEILAYVGVMKGTKGLIDQTRTGIDRAIGTLTFGQQWDLGRRTGMSPGEFMEASGEHRRAMIATGGINQSIDILAKTAGHLEGDVASRAEASKFALQQMEMLTTVGIRPTTARVQELASSFKALHATTGMTVEEFNNAMRGITENEEALHEMRLATSEAERKSVLDAVRARYRENRLRGISDEQTQAMLKKQQEMTNAKPKSRYKEAVRMAALAGAFGAEGGGELIELAMKPAHMLTREERARQQDIHTRLNTQVIGGFGSTHWGTQLLTESLTDKLGYDTREMSVFDTRLAQVVGAVSNNEQTSRAMFGEIGTFGRTINSALEDAVGALKNPFTQILLGMGGVIAALAANTWALLRAGKVLGGWRRGGKGGRPGKETGRRQPRGGDAPGDETKDRGTSESKKPDGKDGGKDRKTRGRKGGGRGGFARGAKLSLAGILSSMVLGAGADIAEDMGHTKTAAGLDIAGSTLGYAGTGAMIGSVIPGLGTVAGGLIGGAIGLGKGVYDNLDAITGENGMIASTVGWLSSAADSVRGWFRTAEDYNREGLPEPSSMAHVKRADGYKIDGKTGLVTSYDAETGVPIIQQSEQHLIADILWQQQQEAMGPVGSIIQTAGDTFSTVKDSLLGSLNLFQGHAVKAANTLGGKLQEWYPQVQAAAVDWYQQAVSVASSWYGTAVDVASEWTNTALVTAREWYGNAMTAARGWMDVAVSTAQNWYGVAVDTATDWGSAAKSAAQTATNAARKWYGNVIKTATNWYENTLVAAEDWYAGVVETGTEAVSATISAVSGWYTNATTTAKAWYDGAMSSARGWLESATTTTRRWYDDALSASSKWYSEAIGDAKSWYGNLSSTITGWLTSFGSTASSLFDSAVSTAQDWYSNISSVAGSVMDGATEAAQEWYNNAVAMSKEWYSNIQTAGVQLLDNMVDTATDWFSSAVDFGESAITTVTEAVVSGSDSAIDYVKSWFSDSPTSTVTSGQRNQAVVELKDETKLTEIAASLRELVSNAKASAATPAAVATEQVRVAEARNVAEVQRSQQTEDFTAKLEEDKAKTKEADDRAQANFGGLHTSMIDSINKQIEQITLMNETNAYLKTISERLPELIELSEQQLMVMLREEEEAKASPTTAGTSRRKSRSYSYI